MDNHELFSTLIRLAIDGRENEAIALSLSGKRLWPAPARRLLAKAQSSPLSMPGDDGEAALGCALRHGREALARSLIDQGADLSGRDHMGFSMAESAARNGLAGALGDILAEYGSKARRLCGDALLLAQGADCVRALAGAGIDIEACDAEGKTPLIRACERGDASAARALASLGAKTQTTDKQGRSPLIAACQNAHSDCALLFAKEPLEDSPDAHGMSALMWCARLGLSELAAALIEAGSNPNAAYPKSGGMGALFFSCMGGKYSCAKALLDAGADPNFKDSAGRSPSMIAASSGHDKICALLAEGGAAAHVNQAGR